MKFYLDGLEVEIKARKPEGRYNKEDSAYIANLISMYASEAAHRYRSVGMDALESVAKIFSNSIYETLAENGVYAD